jgi:chromate transport protein ChrA
MGAIIGLIYLAVIVLVIAGFWKVFVKAGQPGWASIIPIYNLYVLTQIVGKPAWWVILFFIPLVNVITRSCSDRAGKVSAKSAVCPHLREKVDVIDRVDRSQAR